MAERISKEVLISRLKKIEGQVRGIGRMIEEDRDCESLVMQLAAIRSAVESVGALLLKNYLQFCFHEGEPANSAEIASLARAIAIWGKIRVDEL